jgi:hypothetical protein
MRRNLDPTIIRQQIENLKVSHPALVEDDEAWQMSLESETDINDLLTTIVRRIEDTKALVIGTKDRFEELKARKDRFEHRIEALRELAFKVMQTAEVAKLELPECTLSLRAGQQQLVGEFDPNALPDSLVKISRTVDRAAVKDAIKNGVAVPGFELTNGPPSITIRVK